MKRKFLVKGEVTNIYTLLERVEDFDGQSDSRPQWRVVCRCGKEKIKVNRSIATNKYCGAKCGLRNGNRPK